MKMKKEGRRLLSLILCMTMFLLALAACGNTKRASIETQPAQTKKNRNFR